MRNARSLGRAVRELCEYGGGEVGDELLVLDGAALGVALPALLACLRVGKTFLLSLRDGVRLSEHALALVPLAAAAPLHDHGGQSAGLPRAAGQRRVATRQTLQVTEVGAVPA